MSIVSVGDIAKCANLALRLWQYGWSSNRNAATRYRDFGADVYGLNKNLQQLQKVFEDVQDEAGGPGIIPQSSSFYDTRALMTILDEPLRTLEDCDRLLRNRTYFAEDQGAAVNIYWNLAIEEEVTQLQHRVMFHNVKIAALLQPLQIKLMLDTQGLIRYYGNHTLAALSNVEVQLNRIEALMFGTGDSTLPPASQAMRCAQVIFPDLLRESFENVSKSARPNIETDENFPMYDGINAFLRHYKEDNNSNLFSGGLFQIPTNQSPPQYLSMMKSIWIIARVQECREYRLACQAGNRLLMIFVEGLAQKCIDEFRRHAEGPPMPGYNPYKVANEPTAETLLPLGEEAWAIWPKPTRQSDNFDETTGSDQLNTILRARLQHRTPYVLEEMILLRRGDTMLEMVTKKRRQIAGPFESMTKDIDLKLAALNPVYADPHQRTQSIAVTLSTSHAGNEEYVDFMTYKHLYQFQEAITGYRPVLNIEGAEISIQADRRCELVARVQIWSHEVDPSEPTQDPVAQALSSPIATSRGDGRNPSASSSSAGLSSSSSSNGLSSSSRGGASRSTNASSSRSNGNSQFGSSVGVRSRITQDSGFASLTGTPDNRHLDFDATVFTEPKEPLIVMFLRPNQPRDGQSSNLSLMKIPMRQKSAILSTTHCSCRTAIQAFCTHVRLTGPKSTFRDKPLMAQQYLGNGRQSINLALLGLYHEHAGATSGYYGSVEKKLSIVEMKFREPSERQAFVNVFRKLQETFERKTSAYHNDKRQVRFGSGMGT